jgi:hypothetical protein
MMENYKLKIRFRVLEEAQASSFISFNIFNSMKVGSINTFSYGSLSIDSSTCLSSCDFLKGLILRKRKK